MANDMDVFEYEWDYGSRKGCMKVHLDQAANTTTKKEYVLFLDNIWRNLDDAGRKAFAQAIRSRYDAYLKATAGLHKIKAAKAKIIESCSGEIVEEPPSRIEKIVAKRLARYGTAMSFIAKNTNERTDDHGGIAEEG